jgi:pimeloyl-ACP methyl ester carboxylesterase
MDRAAPHFPGAALPPPRGRAQNDRMSAESRVVVALCLLPLLACEATPAADGDAPDAAPETPDAAPETPDAAPEAPDAAPEAPDAGPPDPTAPRALREALADLDTEPCPDLPDFFCGAVESPLDPTDSAAGAPTVSIAFAARPASGEASLGLLFELSGGPGYSGLAEADDWTWLDPDIAESFDMVFFDLRGVGESGGFDCPIAAAAWYGRGLRAATADARDALAERAARFAAACTAEIAAAPEVQARHDTLRAAFDLEVLRNALGGAPATLSGVSYGTQLAQTYTTLFPEHVRAVLLDGAIDLTRRGLSYALDLTAAVEDVRARTLAACADTPDCAADFAPTTPAAAYDALFARLEAGPLAFEFPLADATIRPRTLDAVEFDQLAFVALYDEGLRPLWLRALAAAARERFVPMRRLLDTLGGVDPADDAIAPTPFEDTGFSDAMYYTITCHDYGRATEGVAGWLSACAAAGENARILAPCFGDLPCATWPTAPPEPRRPDTFAPAGVPVLVINADADIATPVVQGRAVVSGLRSAGASVREIAVAGGHHVMWGSDACVDAAASAFLFDPETPRADTRCDVGVLGPALALMPADAAAYADAAAFVSAFATELAALPEFPYPSAWGCDAGGTGEIDDFGALAFDACRPVPDLDLQVDGGGAYDWDTGALSLEITVMGAHTGTLSYAQDAGGEATVSGTWDGARVE